jgi:hypothetical protein
MSLDVNISSPLAMAPLSNFLTSFLKALTFIKATEWVLMMVVSKSLDWLSSRVDTYNEMALLSGIALGLIANLKQTWDVN